MMYSVVLESSMDEPKVLEQAEDGRSIGYWEEGEGGGKTFFALILWGYTIHSYVSSDCEPGFREVKVVLPGLSGLVFYRPLLASKSP